MKPTIQKIIEIIYDILFIGKTAAKDIQISGDATAARRIKKAVAEGDLQKLRKEVMRGGILIDETDILGIWGTPENPGILISIKAIVNYRQMFKDIRRYKRARGV